MHGVLLLNTVVVTAYMCSMQVAKRANNAGGAIDPGTPTSGGRSPGSSTPNTNSSPAGNRAAAVVLPPRSPVSPKLRRSDYIS